MHRIFNLILQFIFISVCFCEITDDKEKYISAFVNHLNGLPDQNLFYEDWESIKLEEVSDNELYTEIKIKASDQNVYSKYQNCTGYITIEENGKLRVHGAQCSDIVESWTENMEELVTDVTTNDGPIQLENEVQTENMSTSGERFIAVPRERPAPCIGCASNVDPNAVGVKDLADLGIKQLNRHEPNVHHSLNTILVVERQVQAIGGVRYIITLTVDSNNCTLNETEDCNFQKTCKIAVLEKPWQRLADGSKFRAILSNNCTEEWLFDENGLTTPSDSNFNNQSNDIGTSTSDNYDNTENEDNVKAIHNIEVQAQPNAEKTLTEEQMRELEDQIIPLNKFNQPTDNSYFAVSDATQTHVAEEKVNNLEAVKSKSNDFMATQEPERRRDDESLSDDKKKAIDDLLNFFDFSGIKSTADNDDLSRIKRDYGSDLQMFKLADKYKTMKTKMKNAQFIQKLAQSLVDYLNEMDIEVKTRMLKEVISAEEEFEKDQRYFYVQARVAIPCDNDKCKDKEVKMCNGIIDATGNQPSVLYTVCSNEPTKGLGKLKDIRHDDPILLKFLNHAMKKLDMESKLPYALRIRKILSASTQRVSGTLTKISVEIEYTECFKTVPLFRRRNCTVLENLGFKLCDIEVFERHWLRETKITYVCTERPVDEIFVNDPKNNTKEASTRLNIDDPQVLDIVQEALQYLEEKSNRNNKQKLVEVKSISTQQLAGLLIDVDFTVGYTACTSQFKDDINTCKLLENEPLRNCSVEVWERPWLDEERLVNVTCDKLSSKSDVIKRYKRNTHVGSQVEKNVENPKYKNLAEESLQKYLQSGVSQHHQLIDIEKVTVQVVSGTKTRIDFHISPTNCQIDSNGLPTSANCVVQNSNDIITCHSEIWERQWLNSTDIDVTCDSKSKQSRKRRSILLNGNEVEEQPNKYKELADDCITNFLVTYGYTQHYKVLKVNRVTKLNVNGELIKLDFVAASTNCKVKNGYPISSPCEIIDNRKILFCHADVWNKSMMNGRIMNVNCEPEEEKFRKKRDTARVGSFIIKDKSDPRYKELAAKSLSKYILKKHKSQYHEVVSIEQVTSQVVSGINTKIDFKASPTNCEVDRHGKPTSSLCEIENPDIILLCSSEIWEQPWLGKEEITVNCHPDKSRVKRWLSEVPDYTKYKLVGGPMEQNANDPKYMQLAEESLAKYVSTNGFTQKHTIIRVEKVTTQVVSGSKTKIDFKVQSPSNVLDCHSEIWDRPWLKEKEINIQCLPTTSRKKRTLPGGLEDQDKNDPKYMQMAEESLAKYVSTNGFTQKHTIIRVEKVTTQVVSGSKTKIDFKVQSPTNVLDCHSEIWDRPWLKEKEINIQCLPTTSRKKRQLAGGLKDQDKNDPKYMQMAEESLAKYVSTNGFTQKHTIFRVEKVTTQVVSGTKTKIDFKVQSPTNVLDCHSEIWDRPWLKEKEINIQCLPTTSRKKRQLAGGLKDQDKNDPKYMQMAEESLAKYVSTNGFTQKHTIIRVEKVTTQVVAGSLTKIYFKVQSPTNVLDCHSKIWEQSWLNKKEINVTCSPSKSRKRREVQLFNAVKHVNRFQSIDMSRRSGGHQEQDPTKPEYSQLAEEALQKYQQRKSSEFLHKVTKVNRVVKQVVSGTKYQIDFTAAPTTCSSKVSKFFLCDPLNSTVLYCHTDIWDRPWLKRKDINVFCNLSGGDSDQENGSNNQDDRKKRSIAVLREPETEEYKLDNLTSPLDNKIETPEDRNNDMDSPIVVSKHMENSDYLKQLKFYNNRYLHVAEESLRKYEIVSESEVFYKVIQIHYVNEEEDFGLRLRLDFTAAPSNCSISKHSYSNHCQVIEPEMSISCHADVRYTLMLEANLVQDIEIHCKRKKTKNFNEKSMEKVRNKRYIPYDENVEDDILYYYADVIVGKLNDEKHSDKQNLYKLITIHDARRTVHMKTPLVRMYLEVAKSYCLRDQSLEQLSACNEIENMPHLLCFARLWPSSYDDAVLEASEFSCEDNFMSFSDQTGLHSNQLLQLSLLILNRESPLVNIFRSLGDTRIVPTLDYKEPTKLSFYAFQTNCTKEYAAAAGFDSKLVGDTCFPTQFETARSCMSLIYMTPNSRDVRYVNVTCTSPITNRRQKRSLPIRSDNITREDVTIQRLLHESLEKLEMDSVHRYKQRVLVINRYSTKFGVRKETTIDFDVGYTNCLKYEWVDNITTCEFVEHLPRRHCVSVVFEKLWSDNYREIRVNCDDDETPLEANMELETAQSATILGNEALKRIEYKYPDPYKQIVVRSFSLEKHVVAGIHYRMKMEVGYTNCMALSVDNDCKLDPLRLERKFCRVSVWLRTWTNHPPSYQVSCDYQEGTTSELYHERQAGALFSHFLATYKPSYINNHFELQNRYKIFQENVKKIHELNVYEMGTARYAVTQFADLSPEEFRSKHLGLNPKLRDENQVPTVEAEIPPVNIPDTFDWREHDAVTEVKDQGMCGSCWAFSVTGNIEGQWKRHSGKLVSLSEQELVDCDKLDNGCNGGLPDNAYRAIEQLGGIETENDYPYEGEDDKCAYNASLSRVQISGAVNISSNETNMAKWLYKNGPISIGINANAMQFYVGGISHPWRVMCNPNNLDHGVLIVGYGTKDYPLFNKKLPYWIVKNSWGKSWGEQGYYRVYRGDGTCGVNQMASSSVI